MVDLSKEKFEKLSVIRHEFEQLTPGQLGKSAGLFRWWVLRLLLACFAELYAIAFRLKTDDT
jgi:hypothetical protein